MARRSRKPKAARKPMPKPTRVHKDLRRMNGKRFKDWSDLADYLYCELRRKDLGA